MNLSSLVSSPASSGSVATAGGGKSAGSSSGAFDALVTANTSVVDEAEALVSLSPESIDTASAAVAPTGLAAVSAATMAMLAALDRSATLLAKPQGEAMEPSTPKDDKPVATDPAGSLPAAMMAAFTAVGQALPTIVPAQKDTPSAASAVAAAATPAPKAPVRELPMAAAPTSAMFNAIAAELRSTHSAKTDLADKMALISPETATDTSNVVSLVSPTSAMIRDLASLMANSVTPATPAEGVAVDRHLDLARDDAWLNDLARDIAATAANGGRLKFGLAPESLGRLDVEIRQGQAGVSVHMTTRTDTARDLLTAAQPRIVDEIRAQGVRVAGTEVSTDASGSGAGFGGDRAGNTPRQPLGLPIDVALPTLTAASPPSPASVLDGRYA